MVLFLNMWHVIRGDPSVTEKVEIDRWKGIDGTMMHFSQMCAEKHDIWSMVWHLFICPIDYMGRTEEKVCIRAIRLKIVRKAVLKPDVLGKCAHRPPGNTLPETLLQFLQNAELLAFVWFSFIPHVGLVANRPLKIIKRKAAWQARHQLSSYYIGSSRQYIWVKKKKFSTKKSDHD